MKTWESETPIDDDKRDRLIKLSSWALMALRKGLNLNIEIRVCTPDNIIKEEKHGFN